ncbi:MAG: DUF3823 domain-containing protein [Draconibacterium sp.]
MKKIIILFAAVISIVFTSCEIDNYDAPAAMLSGTVTYNGKPVGVRTNGTQFELWQDGYALNEKIAVHIAQDGTYTARLFNGEYKLVRLAGAPWETQAADTIVINVKGDTQKDIEVKPFFTINDETFEVKGNAVVAEFVVNQVDPSTALKDVKLYLSKNILVDENQKDFALKADNTTIISGQKVTLIATLPQSLDSETYYFARVGVRSDRSNEFYYTQVQELQGDPNGPKNPTADFTSVVNGRDVTFTATSKYVESFMWNFGDGETSTEENPTHTYARGGDYTITLTALRAEGTFPVVVSHDVNVGYVPVAIENGDFQLPGTGKITTWDLAPGWTCDSETTDSGLDGPDSNGNYWGYCWNQEGSVYQLTDHIILDGEQFKLTFDAWDAYFGGDNFVATLYYDTGNGARNIIATKTFATLGNGLELIAPATEGSVGARLGVEFKAKAIGNTGWGNNGWTGFDNVQLFAK